MPRTPKPRRTTADFTIARLQGNQRFLAAISARPETAQMFRGMTTRDLVVFRRVYAKDLPEGTSYARTRMEIIDTILSERGEG